MAIDWKTEFSSLYDRAAQRYASGATSADKLLNSAEVRFLASIGYRPVEFFDFVDDAARYGAPDKATALAVAAIRRDYFLQKMDEMFPPTRLDMTALPAKTDELDGIVWLPRLIPKAKAKLRGEMPDDLMYGCGGDRAFFQKHGLTADGFLAFVRDHWDDIPAIVRHVKSRGAA
jgi:hypothetical protein